MSTLLVLTIIAFFLLLLLYAIGWFDRLVYFLILLLLSILIVGRIACEKTACFWEHIKWYFSQLSLLNYVPCAHKDCEADWSLRGGIDEAGLILTGVFFFVTVLFVKNIKITDLVKNISKITLLGAFEAEVLDQKVSSYSKKELDKIDQDVIKRFEKIEDKIIEKTDTVEERLLLLDREINEVLRDLYEKLIEKSSTQRVVDPEIILQKLDENKILEQELVTHLKDFNAKVYTNAFRLGGKRSNGLNITGSKILKLLLIKRKQVFQRKRVFYQGVESVAIERPNFHPKKEDNLLELDATIFMVDVNGNSFPLDNLTVDNFAIEESLGLETNIIKPSKVDKATKGKKQLNLIMMIDCSTSMKEDLKLEKSKEAAIKFLQRINDLDNLVCKVVLYCISSEQQGFVASKWFDSTELELYQHIQNLQIAGGTPLFSSLKDTLDLASRVQQGNTMIICLTDGESAGENLTLEDIIESVKNVRVPIISIGFGNEAYTSMIQISERSGAGGAGAGYFIGAEPHEINRIFEDISDSIACSYRISWMPGFENQEQVDLKLRVIYKDKDGKEHHDVYKIVPTHQDERTNEA